LTSLTCGRALALTTNPSIVGTELLAEGR